MKSIDIRTTQNVTISYELASSRDRILAYFIDMIIKLVIYVLAFLMFEYIFSNRYKSDIIYIYFFLIVLPPIVFYSLFCEYVFHGQTPGKMLLKIRVVKLNGKQPDFYDYMLRWCFRLVDLFLSGGVLAAILVSSTDHAQRLGDLVSNTTVVRVRDRHPISLAEIMKIETKHNYVPQYELVRNFPEEDIVLIKNTLVRYSEIKNKAHEEIIDRLVTNVASRLQLTEIPEQKIPFLRTVIKDFIVLTR
ncbi:MAG: RDD family protein [Flavobacteriales bacterium]|nr:RDD family protein [Flavobacteriales bacterium]